MTRSSSSSMRASRSAWPTASTARSPAERRRAELRRARRRRADGRHRRRHRAHRADRALRASCSARRAPARRSSRAASIASPAARGSFQAINCAAIPHNLLESELFGYRRGAFSGADRDKPGLIKLADNGTLFLDEIGDMPLDAQAKLLRVLQAARGLPARRDDAGACRHPRRLRDAPRSLPAREASESFRGDLLARLNEHAVRLPPLRERKEDIYLLAQSFFAALRATRAARSRSRSWSRSSTTTGRSTSASSRAASSAASRSTDGGELDTTHLPDAIARS